MTSVFLQGVCIGAFAGGLVEKLQRIAMKITKTTMAQATIEEIRSIEFLLRALWEIRKMTVYN